MRSLYIDAAETEDGIRISLHGKDYPVCYPQDIWEATHESLREALVENIAFASTHFLGPMLKYEKLHYNIRVPLLESFLFRNQLCDLLSCELADNARHLSYLKRFYNLEYEFVSGDSRIPSTFPAIDTERPAAVIPFTFGKESLCTYALVEELGMRPILVYCQEPVQPFEEKYKQQLLNKLTDTRNVACHFIKNAPGLFRYGTEFKDMPGIKLGTEIGWGTQTTILAMMMLPFNFFYDAQYIFFGSEYSNNEFLLRKGWKTYLSYDQSSFWTVQQNNLIRLLTMDQCRVRSSLEPLEELAIFYLLHSRYPELGSMQFSCSAEKELVGDSQWCHQCHKCERMFLFSCCCGIHPSDIGFKRNLLEEPGHFQNILGDEFKSGSQYELEGVFCLLDRAGLQGPYMDQFRTQCADKCESYEQYLEFFTTPKGETNLPVNYFDRLYAIFKESNQKLAQVLENLKTFLPDVTSWPT